MKKALQVAKNEVYSLFFSPIAWVMITVFVIMSNNEYTNILNYMVRCYRLGGEAKIVTGYLTGGLIAGQGWGLLPKIIGFAYLFLPLVTMGLISRESNNGTIRLLYSSPIKIWEVVLGKYLAMLVFNGVLLFITCFDIMSFVISVNHPQYIHVVFSMVGLLLVLMTYSAIGLFISSLTTYQIVAALITFVLFYFLNIVSDLWQKILVLKDLAAYLYLRGKSENLLNSLFNLRDVCYFLTISAAFLAFTVIRIRSAMESIPWYRKAVRYVVVILVAFAIGYTTSNPWINVYHDATVNQLFTITPNSQALLKQLDADLEVTSYANILDEHFHAFSIAGSNEMYRRVWEPYLRFKPNITFKRVYYYDGDTTMWFVRRAASPSIKEAAVKTAKLRHMSLYGFLTPEEVSQYTDVKKEGYRCFWVLKYKGRSTVLRCFDDDEMVPDEEEIAAALNRLIGTPPKVDFLTDEIERSPYGNRRGDYTDLTSKLGRRFSLLNQGYDFDTLSLSKVAAVPDGLAALVIADPRKPFSEGNLAKILKYIDEGGNLLIACEPSRKEVVRPILDKIGVRLRDGILFEPDAMHSADNVFPVLTDTAMNLTPRFRQFIDQRREWLGDILFRIGMPGVAAIDWLPKDGFNVHPLAVTDPAKSWNRIAPIDPDSLNLNLPRLPSDQIGSFTTAVLMDRNRNGRDQRIIVTGDADYMSYPAIGSFYTSDFDMWHFSAFTNGKFPQNTIRYDSPDNSFRIELKDVPYHRIFLCWILPGLIAISGAVVLIKRIRK